MKINRKVKKIYILSFLFSLHIAFSAYINSTFLSEIIGEKYVGILYTVSSIIILSIFSTSSYLLSRFGNKNLISIFLLLNIFGLSILIKNNNPLFVSIGFILFQSTNTIVFLFLDIFIEHFGSKKIIGKQRSNYLTINNLAWVLSPIVSGILISRTGGSYKSIYIVAFLFVIFMTISLMFSVRTFRDPRYTKKPLLSSFKYLIKNRHLLAINSISFILQFFYVWMVIYTPIYLNEYIGIPWSKIGLMFTIMLLPFILVSIPVGYLIDRYHVSKRLLLVIGMIIASISTFIIPFINHDSNIIIFIIILFCTRIGASIIETTSEIYFFSHTTEEETNLLSFFRDMSPIAYLLAPILGTIILYVLDIRFMFFILSLILLSGLYFIPKLKHNHEISD